MTRAEEKAVEYQIRTYGPNVMGGASMLSEEEYMRFNMNLDFKNGYEQAEKETITKIREQVEKWMPDNPEGDEYTSGERVAFRSVLHLLKEMEK